LLWACGAVLAGAGLGGCAAEDPLDEPVDADTWNDLLLWQRRHVEPLGEPIASEFQEALVTLARKTPGFRAPSSTSEYSSPYNPLCQRIDGWPLRRVIIEGYELNCAALRDKLFLEQMNANTLRVRANDEGVNVSRALLVNETMTRHWEDRLRRHEARLRELRPATP
jgi:hypothetical protein